MNSWIIETLGWTLLHSFWQIGFAALILFLALQILRESSANFRYLASISAVILSLILPIATFVYLSSGSTFLNIVKTPPATITKSAPPIKNAASVETIEKTQVSRLNATVQANASPSSKIPFLPILVGLWLIGVLIFSIRLTGGVWTVHLYKTRKVSAVEKHWQEKFGEFCESLQIRQKVTFLQSQMVEMPVVIGWLKPIVLVPASAFLQISSKELETILIHELTHIKRNDYLINLGQSLVEILFFFHPCVWWMSARMRSEREFAVDEIVSQIFETERFVYAKALAQLEDSRAVAPTLAMAADGGNLMKRIEKILNGSRKINSKNVSIWSAVFAVTLILGLTVGGYWFRTTKNEKGRRVAVVFSDFSDKEQQNNSYQNLVELQNKFKVPATWILDSNLIDALKKNESAKIFFHQANENRSDFIVNVPNISYTIFMNGEDEYFEGWKKRIEFIEENLVNNDDKLKHYSIGRSSQIPQEMEKTLAKKGLRQVKVPYSSDLGFKFDFIYEKDCSRIEETRSCKDQSAVRQKEIREKYLQYVTKIFELNEEYSQEKFGAIMPEILILRGGGLTRDSAGELLQMLQDKGYEFVPLEDVTSNEIFNKMSKEDKELSQRKWKTIDQYVQKEFPFPTRSTDELKRAMDNLQKSYKIDVTTTDLKVRP